MKTVSLLIVDDDPVFGHFVRQLVLALGADFPCAPQLVDTPDKALAELERLPYDLMLLDYHLPGADGLQVLANVRELPDGRQPAVIMLTGSGNETVAVEAMKRGASDYLTKANLELHPLRRALQNALARKQLGDQLARFNAQARADLEMARHLQQSLLPDVYPRFPSSASPADSALRFCHRFLPASELAGDFFSVFPLSDTQAGVFVCDVMGHGVRSALVTAMIRALVDNVAARAGDPGHFLARMNRRLTGLLRPADTPLFATAFYLVADIGSGLLRYATAGHPAPLHLHRQQGTAAPLATPPRAGPALGMFPDAVYATGETPLAAGDVILAFTDGLYEAAKPDSLEEYGRERLLAGARRRMNLAGPELCDALVADVRAFAGGGALVDDVCLLSIEVLRVCHPNPEPLILNP